MAGIRARRRPRVRSVNFRRLKYVLVREAALAIMFPYGPVQLCARRERGLLLRFGEGRILAAARATLELHPERRYWPPGAR